MTELTSLRSDVEDVCERGKELVAEMTEEDDGATMMTAVHLLEKRLAAAERDATEKHTQLQVSSW